jgi:dethiobiotin synthetase
MPAAVNFEKSMAGLFVVGSDTGVGKTFVTCAVARLLRRQGQAVEVCKPVATGAELQNGVLLGDDTRRLAEAAGHADYRRVTPWTFALPTAPPVAARAEGVELRLDDMANRVLELLSPHSLLLVEGIGGLLCPLTERETVADLVLLLGFPLIVVVRRSLGTLNHTLLTLEAARHRGVNVAGVVVNETSPARDPATATNVEELSKRIAVPLLAVVPYQIASEEMDIASLAAVDWKRLAAQAKDE